MYSVTFLSHNDHTAMMTIAYEWNSILVTMLIVCCIVFVEKSQEDAEATLEGHY